jgi:bifunctional DNA-binding transcriptional regulator/antitoxin component of YhaV-PrlF toxin-antitoxin module
MTSETAMPSSVARRTSWSLSSGSSRTDSTVEGAAPRRGRPRLLRRVMIWSTSRWRFGLYNEFEMTYNAAMATARHLMTISRNGQVSIPAATRSRWKTRRVVVVDLGDRVVMRPLAEDAVGELEGKYRGRGPDTERARQQGRSADAARERHR